MKMLAFSLNWALVMSSLFNFMGISSICFSRVAAFTQHNIERLPYSHKTSSSLLATKKFVCGAGCFWAPADNMKKIKGISNVQVGYCGDDTYNGKEKSPTYDFVCSGRSKLVEAVYAEYDDSILSYEQMLNIFNDVNTAEFRNKRQYEGIIFTQSKEEEKIANDFLSQPENKYKVVAKVEPMSKSFYIAEKYHQNYWQKWRLRIPLLVLSLAIIGKFGGEYLGRDVSQNLYNIICYAFIGFTLLERRFDTNVGRIDFS